MEPDVSVHVKKCWPEQFQAVRDGSKPFEWRKEDDCRYEVGDLLVLLEWRPKECPSPERWIGAPWLSKGYTGEFEKRTVTYVLRGAFGVPEGYVVLGLRKA
jgi:hypothetical protein